MRYRFVTDLFGLRLDKRRFRADFGMPVELGAVREIAFLTAVGALASNTSERRSHADVEGPLPALVMMREGRLAASNDVGTRPARIFRSRNGSAAGRRITFSIDWSRTTLVAS